MTMHPYYKDGHPVFKDGKPYWCDHCPCDYPCSVVCPPSSWPANGFLQQYLLTLSINHFQTEVDDINATYYPRQSYVFDPITVSYNSCTAGSLMDWSASSVPYTLNYLNIDGSTCRSEASTRTIIIRYSVSGGWNFMVRFPSPLILLSTCEKRPPFATATAEYIDRYSMGTPICDHADIGYGYIKEVYTVKLE